MLRGNSMRIGIVGERRYLAQEMPSAVARAFEARGIGVDVICPHAIQFYPDVGVVHGEGGREYALNHYDVIVSRTRNALGLAILAFAEVAGIPAINTHAATQRVRNKAKMAIRLHQAGIHCAPTVLASDAGALADLTDHWFPLILKATYGDPR